VARRHRLAEERDAADELFDRLKPFKELVAEDIRDGDSE
jgi:hypothetical protein